MGRIKRFIAKEWLIVIGWATAMAIATLIASQIPTEEKITGGKDNYLWYYKRNRIVRIVEVGLNSEITLFGRKDTDKMGEKIIRPLTHRELMESWSNIEWIEIVYRDNMVNESWPWIILIGPVSYISLWFLRSIWWAIKYLKKEGG